MACSRFSICQRLRHMHKLRQTLFPAILALLVASGCAQATPELPGVTIVADGRTQVVSIGNETTVSDVLRSGGIETGDLDRVNPPKLSRVSPGMTITVVRVREETNIEQESVPYERQTVPNDSLPAGETRLLQSGINGVAEVTYRIIYEDGVEVSRSQVRRVVITPPKSELVMVGSQGELPTVTVNGTLVYISSSNIWVMRQNSANRRPLTLDGGVDGRVFEISQDGRRLLFTRTLDPALAENAGLATSTPSDSGSGDSAFNSLWVIFDTSDPQSEAVRLDLDNILYADWVPGSERTIVYSTAEPRASFPGWQANNDLWTAQVSANGAILHPRQLLESSSGGIYGWYGTFFDFSPDGLTLAWAQPDSVGILNPVTSDDGSDATPTPQATDEVDASVELPSSFQRDPLFHFAPRNAYDFVWVPGLAWSPDGSLLLTVTHGASLGTESPEDSPVFNITALPREGGYSVDLVPQAGMWGLAQYSPPQAGESEDEIAIAYLKADDPLDSVVSRYRLAVMDRDGSNSRIMFPSQDQQGIAPKDLDYRGFVWSPDARQIALVYQGNLYLIDVVTGLEQQLTRDGLATNPRWTPVNLTMRKLLFRILPPLLVVIAISACIAVIAQRQMQLRGALQGFPPLNTPQRVPILGVNADLTQYDEAALGENLDLIKQTGFIWVRQTFSWGEIEPEPGQSDWTVYDFIVDAVSIRGLRLVAVLADLPEWAAPTPETPPDNLSTFNSFAAAIADRYGDRIDVYQIWDEPNLSSGWGGQPDVITYAALLEAAYRAIHAADDQALILTAGLAPTTEAGPDNLSDLLFLRALYENGAAPFFDGVAGKPYGFDTGPEDRRVILIC